MSRVLRHFAATLSLLFASQICAAQTPNTCSIAGYAFEYVNGMYNTWTDVESGEAALRKALGPTHNGRPIAIESTWNRTDPGLDDLRQAFRQLVNVHPELVDTWFVGILPFVSGTVDEVLQDISDPWGRSSTAICSRCLGGMEQHGGRTPREKTLTKFRRSRPKLRSRSAKVPDSRTDAFGRELGHHSGRAFSGQLLRQRGVQSAPGRAG